MPANALPRLKILIVDEKANGVTLLRSILSALGSHDIVATAHTDAAMAVQREARFDVVFCDEAIKPLNPIAFTHAVRRDSGSKNCGVPILVVTSVAKKRQIELARDCGANHVIVRPVSLGIIRSKLEALMLRPVEFVKSDSFLGPDRRRGGRRAPKGKVAAIEGEERRSKRGRRKSDIAESVEVSAPPAGDSKRDFFL